MQDFAFRFQPDFDDKKTVDHSPSCHSRSFTLMVIINLSSMLRSLPSGRCSTSESIFMLNVPPPNAHAYTISQGLIGIKHGNAANLTSVLVATDMRFIITRNTIFSNAMRCHKTQEMHFPITTVEDQLFSPETPA